MLSKNKPKSILLLLLAAAIALTLAACSPTSGGNETDAPDASQNESNKESENNDQSDNASSESESTEENKKLNLDDVKDKFAKSMDTVSDYPAYAIQSYVSFSVKIMNFTIDLPLSIMEIKKGTGNDLRYQYSLSCDDTTGLFADLGSDKVFINGYLYRNDSTLPLKQPMTAEEFAESLKNGSDSPTSEIDMIGGFKTITASYDEAGNIFIEFSDPLPTFANDLLSSMTDEASLFDIGDIDLKSISADATMTADGVIIMYELKLELSSTTSDDYGSIELKLDMHSHFDVYTNADDMGVDVSVPENADEYIEVDNIDNYEKLESAINSTLSRNDGKFSATLYLQYTEFASDNCESTYDYKYAAGSSGSFDFGISSPYFDEELTMMEEQTGYDHVDYTATNSYTDGLFITKDDSGENTQNVDADTVYYSYIYNYLSYAYADTSALTALSSSYNEATKMTTVTFDLQSTASYNMISEYALQFNIDLSLAENNGTVTTLYTISFSDDFKVVSSEYTIVFKGNYENVCDVQCALALLFEISNQA